MTAPPTRTCPARSDCFRTSIGPRWPRTCSKARARRQRRPVRTGAAAAVAAGATPTFLSGPQTVHVSGWAEERRHRARLRCPARRPPAGWLPATARLVATGTPARPPPPAARCRSRHTSGHREYSGVPTRFAPAQQARTTRPVHQVELLAVDQRPVELEDLVASPDRSDHVGRGHPQTGFFGQLPGGGLGQPLTRSHLAPDGEPPLRRRAVPKRRVRRIRSAQQQHGTAVIQ